MNKYIHSRSYISGFEEIKKDEEVLLKPYVEDLDGIKHYAPKIENHVQINSISYKSIYKEGKQPYYQSIKEIIADFVIFDRYHVYKRKDLVTYQTYISHSHCTYYILNRILKNISLLNDYIEQGGDINDILMERFNLFSYVPEEPILNIIKLINRMEFTYYVEGRTVAKKDDFMWYEVEINNLPQNDYYIMDLLKECMGKIGSVRKRENMLVVEFDNGIPWKTNYKRRKCEYNKDFKERLLSLMIQKYDYSLHSYQTIISSPKYWE
jgi:hypothetical protein